MGYERQGTFLLIILSEEKIIRHEGDYIPKVVFDIFKN